MFIGGSHFLSAQRVLYSPIIETRSNLQVEVAGKAGDFYWFKINNQERSSRNSLGDDIKQHFIIYDSRMNPVKTFVAPDFKLPVLKEYFICGQDHFDRLVLLADHEKMLLVLDRYQPDGTQVFEEGKIVGNLPFSESGNSFLLARSEDQQKILVVCFQSLPDAAPRLHALLFDQDWNQLYYRKFEHPFITQPIRQDDFISFPIEAFTNSPLKLANSGQWVMLSPSRINYNYLLFNFGYQDTGFVYKEIPLPSSSAMEDLALSVDNETESASAAVLSKFRYPALKNVEVVHYSISKKKLDFDSSYRFSTLSGARIKNDNLVHESLIAVPKKGFMLLKEYGRTFTSSYEDILSDNPWDIEALFVTNAISTPPLLSSINQDGYTRYDKLAGGRGTFERGDLNLFYLPASSADSCWSGILDKEQITELNSPDLSYLTLPINNRLFFFYNSFFGGSGQFGSTTILDNQGNLQTEGGGAFWKFKNILDFQQSRQITANEIAIPYANSRRNGFAIIRF
jgi:hypothetical protein